MPKFGPLSDDLGYIPMDGDISAVVYEQYVDACLPGPNKNTFPAEDIGRKRSITPKDFPIRFKEGQIWKTHSEQEDANDWVLVIHSIKTQSENVERLFLSGYVIYYVGNLEWVPCMDAATFLLEMHPELIHDPIDLEQEAADEAVRSAL